MKYILAVLLAFFVTTNANAVFYAQGGIMRGRYSVQKGEGNLDPLKGVSFQIGGRFRRHALNGNFGFQMSLGYEYSNTGSTPDYSRNNDKSPWHFDSFNIRPGVSYLSGLEGSFSFLAAANVAYNLTRWSSFTSVNFDLGAGYSGALLVCSFSQALAPLTDGSNSRTPHSFNIGIRLYPDLF